MKTLEENTQLIERANQFLSPYSINRYVEKPLYELDLNQESLTDYFKREQLFIYLNELNPLVAMQKVTFIDILISVRQYVNGHGLDEQYYCQSMNFIDVFLLIEQNGHQQEFVNDMSVNVGYPFEELSDILNCLTLKAMDMPIGDQLRVSSLLQIYLCLTDKAKAIKEIEDYHYDNRN